MRGRVLVGLLGLFVLAAAAGSAIPARPAAPTVLRIQKLSGSVTRLGTWGGYPLLGVRLQATVCLGSSSEAMNTYPDETGVSHFAVSGSPKHWWLARSVADRAPWLVPLGETWQGKACGKVVVEDPIPPEHYGVESLGNPQSCYGVALSIKAGSKRASKRAIIQCGGLHAK